MLAHFVLWTARFAADGTLVTGDFKLKSSGNQKLLRFSSPFAAPWGLCFPQGTHEGLTWQTQVP